MATLTNVEDAFAALLAAGGRQIVEGRIGEAGAPANPYAIWSLDNFELSDFPTKIIDETTQRIISTNTPLVFLVDFCGGAAMADAAAFALSFRQSQRLADLYKICGLSGISSIQKLNAVEVGRFRERAQLRVTLFAAVDLTAPSELIETICTNVLEPSKPYDETFCVTQGECH